MSDENDVHIKTIEAHMRRLGLTESQVSLHVAPLRAKPDTHQPTKRKVVHTSSVITYFVRPSRKPHHIS